MNDSGAFLVIGFLLGAVPWAGTWIAKTVYHAFCVGADVYGE